MRETEVPGQQQETQWEAAIIEISLEMSKDKEGGKRLWCKIVEVDLTFSSRMMILFSIFHIPPH